MGRTDKIMSNLRTKTLFSGASGVAISSSGWTYDNDGNLFLDQNKTNVFAAIPITGLAVGDTIIAFRVVGGIGGSTETSVLNVSLCKKTKASGASGSTLVQAMTTKTATADGTLDESTELTTPLVLADDYQYFFLIKGKTANYGKNDIFIAGIEVDVKKTFGQPQ